MIKWEKKTSEVVRENERQSRRKRDCVCMWEMD